MSQSRKWCGTLNNYTQDEYDAILDAAPNNNASFVVVGREKAPETGTPHLQVFLYFPSKATLRQLKVVSARAHWEIARGTVCDNIIYCTKDGDFAMAGEPPVDQAGKGALGKRNWTQAREAALAGDVDAVEDDGIYIQCYNSLKKIREDHADKPPGLDVLDNEWRYGSSGVGKSSGARTENPDHYIKDLNKWWCGYRGEDAVIIDDMDPNHAWMGDLLKRWADHYAFACETKGGRMYIRPRRIIVTSQYSIDEIWADEQTRVALKRRFKEKEIQRI